MAVLKSILTGKPTYLVQEIPEQHSPKFDRKLYPLATAILEQAEIDLAHALENNEEGRIREIKRFYMSDWGQLLSDGHGLEIFERIKKEVEAGKWKKTQRCPVGEITVSQRSKCE